MFNNAVYTIIWIRYKCFLLQHKVFRDKIANTSGKIMQTSPSTFMWKLGSGSRKDVCKSETIYICGNKYEFYFRLLKLREDFHALHLLNPQIVFVKLDMKVEMKFYKSTSDGKLENYEVKSFDQLLLVIIEKEQILEIIFTFSNVQDLKQPGYGIGKFYNITDSPGNIVQISPSTFTWKLGGNYKDYIRVSDHIYICGNKYEFKFRLIKIREFFYTLHVLNPQIVFVKLDLHIEMKFPDTTINRKMESYEIKSADQFLLGISHKKDISEITFTLSKTQDLKKPDCETDKFIYKLSNTPGKLVHISPSTFIWNLNSENRKDVRTSEKIYVCGNKYEFYFRLIKIREDFYTLHLLNPEIVFVKLNMDIVVKRSDITTDHTLENYEVKSFDQFILGISHAKDISEITFTFSNAQDLKKQSCERALTMLSGNLKDAFLSKEDSDVILRVGDQTYPAHKVIIRNRSSVFRAMLEHDMTEKNEGIVNIEDGDPHIFKDFLFYLYTGKLENLSKDNVFELYYMSDKYDVDELKLQCLEYIINDLSTDIICDVIALATKHSERNLLMHSIEFFTENAEDIVLTVQWQEFMIANPIQANELIIKAFKRDSRKLKPQSSKDD